MMNTIPLAADDLEAPADAAQDSRWSRVETWLTRIGDRLNPILVKETRQALKSRQFLVSFVLVLTACWLWSLVGVAMIGPRIYYSAEGPELFYGYFLVLAFPLTVIVPYSAYRSLATEQEDNTYELLSISTLTPRQIIAGKLGSAVVQVLVFFSAVGPCLAFTYLLRGIDILTVGVLLYYLFFGALGLSVIALLIATLAKEKYLQVFFSVVLMIGLFYSFGISAAGGAEFLRWGHIGLGSEPFWILHGAILTAYVTYFAMVFLSASAQITFQSENRSTALRVVMLVQHLALVAWMTYAWLMEDGSAEIIIVTCTILGIHWFVLGAFMTGERSELSPRARRSLPQTALGRALFTWFNPGPGTGYMLALASLASAATAAFAAHKIGEAMGMDRITRARETMPYFLAIGFAYIVLYLGAGKLLLDQVRKRFIIPSVLSGGIVHFVLVATGVCAPLIVQSMSADLRFSDYSLLQITNPLWTLTHIVDRSTLPPEADTLIILVPVAAAIVFLLNIPSLGRELRYTRLAPPARVAEEVAELAPPLPEALPESPWD